LVLLETLSCKNGMFEVLLLLSIRIWLDFIGSLALAALENPPWCGFNVFRLDMFLAESTEDFCRDFSKFCLGLVFITVIF